MQLKSRIAELENDVKTLSSRLEEQAQLMSEKEQHQSQAFFDEISDVRRQLESALLKLQDYESTNKILQGDVVRTKQALDLKASEIERWKKDVARLERENTVLIEQHRYKLEELTIDVASMKKSKRGADLNTVASQLFKETLGTYAQHEKHLKEEIERLRKLSDADVGNKNLSSIPSNSLKKKIRDFTMTVQQKLEADRTRLLTRAIVAEELLRQHTHGQQMTVESPRSHKRARTADSADAVADGSVLVFEATTTAPVNIAVIKYWGKRSEALMLPTNSSLSLTLDQDQLQSKTSVRVLSAEIGAGSRNPDAARLWLNGKEEKLSGRVRNLLSTMRKLRADKESSDSTLPRIADSVLHVASVNNFPTAAGLASSASGLACLAFAVDAALQIGLSREQISALARLGSGSACRSLFGGFVAWDMGEKSDGSDSVARQVASETHWPQMRALILVASALQKEMPSTAGMQTTVETSPLLQHRIKSVVPERMNAIEKAILSRDFDSFAEITMRDSNQFHAVCLDTFPPIFYLNHVSHRVIALITKYNEVKSKLTGRKYTAAYTFDAGPNAVLYLLDEDVEEVFRLVNAFFPHSHGAGSVDEYYGLCSQFLKTPTKSQTESDSKLKDEIQKSVKPFEEKDGLKRMIFSKIGDGPRVLGKGSEGRNVSLLDEAGFPKK
ncbi:diphosphomevalonate decarboxylase [Entophlyctis luteolus]|nr:diphosphomevalonate decarboxylase [Entophlyctis luteolus]